jgi:hypothetical protein
MRSSLPDAGGAALLEAVIASGLLATVLAGVLPLVAVSLAMLAAIRTDLVAAQLARQKLAHLQALALAQGPAGLLVDVHSRLDSVEPFASAGPGLQVTGLGTLHSTTDNWADWLDERGAWQGAGLIAPETARFRRRWGILPFGPDGCLRTWVEVAPLQAAAGDRIAHAGSVRCPWGMGEP